MSYEKLVKTRVLTQLDLLTSLDLALFSDSTRLVTWLDWIILARQSKNQSNITLMTNNWEDFYKDSLNVPSLQLNFKLVSMLIFSNDKSQTTSSLFIQSRAWNLLKKRRKRFRFSMFSKNNSDSDSKFDPKTHFRFRFKDFLLFHILSNYIVL